MTDDKKGGAASLDANLGKAEGYLAQFKRSPVKHLIAGEPVAGRSGKTFDTLSPVDNSVLAKVAAGDAADIDAAAKAAAAAFPAWRAIPGAKRRAILHAIADAIVARAEEIALIESMDTGQPIRYMEKAALQGRRELPLLRRPRARRRRRPLAARHRSPQLHHPPAHRPRRHHHAVEHAVHALHLEDRSRAGGGLHGGAQAGRMEPAHGHLAHRDHGRRDPQARRCPPASSTWCTASARRRAARSPSTR